MKIKGMRYVPINGGQWDNAKSYEHLVVVLYKGDSYISNKNVPAGVDITDIEYWSLFSNYNAQLDHLKQSLKEINLNSGIIKNVAAYDILPNTNANLSDKINKLISGGGIFYFPKGVYIIDKPININSNTVIIGESATDTIFRCSVKMDCVEHSFCSSNALNINARLCKNIASGGYPGVDDICQYYVHDVILKNFTIDGNWQNRKIYNYDKEYQNNIIRERGSNLEIQRCYNWTVDGVNSINGCQHNINVRAGAFSYGMGRDYTALYPSYNIEIINCYTNNQFADDGITTHDSYNILISDCVVECKNNINGVNASAISNGIEIDDGSRYVTVQNCISRYNFCGFQAKGHIDTPPAQHISFINCIAENTNFGFSFACNDSNTDTLSDTYFNNDSKCYDITVSDCKIINPYSFNNSEDWRGQVHYFSLLNVAEINIKGLCVVDNLPTHNNVNDTQNHLFMRSRGVCDRVNIENVVITGDIESNTSFIQFDGESRNLNITNFTMGTFNSVKPLISYNSTSQYGYCNIDKLIVRELKNNKNIYSVAGTVKGWRTNCMTLY